MARSALHIPLSSIWHITCHTDLILRSLQEGVVLQVDLNKADRELAEYITLRCSGFGNVVSVNIHREPTPFALVEIANHAQSLDVAAQYGGSMFGTSVLIHLQQQQR
jgi:hypothetical protein